MAYQSEQARFGGAVGYDLSFLIETNLLQAASDFSVSGISCAANYSISNDSTSTAAPVTTTIDWVIPSGGLSLPAVSIAVGDSLVFNWSGLHNVNLHPTGTCDEAGATLVAPSSMTATASWTATAAGTFVFACDMGDHCESGQVVTVTVNAAGVRTSPCLEPGSPYILEGCTPFACVQPSTYEYDFVRAVESSLRQADGSFRVTGVSCIPGYTTADGGDALASVCSGDGEEYVMSGCIPPYCAPTQADNSSNAAAGSIIGQVGASVRVVCDTGYVGGGSWTCNRNLSFTGPVRVSTLVVRCFRCHSKALRLSAGVRAHL